MQRPIIDFALDAEGDWMALLSCGHPQHVRHKPPFVERLWVMSSSGRAAKIGENLNCVRCDRFELPNNFITYKRTPIFTETTIPNGLQNDHSTKRGVWAKIIVTEGNLHYRVPALNGEFDLSPERIGIVVPEVLHRVTPCGAVNFFVEFYKAP